MASPSPSDLLWVLGFKPQGLWIVPILREAVREEWPSARQLARTQLGEDTLARELMELAIEQTHEILTNRPPATVEGARKVLSLRYRNAIRRQRRATRKFLLSGTGSDLEFMGPVTLSGSNVADARIDVDTILRDTPEEIRHALLARYGANAQWADLARATGRSKDSLRMASKRELERLRNKVDRQKRATGNGKD